MEPKKIATAIILSSLGALLSLLGFMKALNHGTSAQIAATVAALVIFLSLFIFVFLQRRKRLLKSRE